MIHPDTELRFVDDVVGYGVFATRLIPRGTITWAPDELDQVFTPARRAALSDEARARLERFTYVDLDGNHVLCWDHARYMNHSCEPNCLAAGYDFEIALRDIQPGEELRDDYGSLNVETDFECRCGRP